jgi:cell division protein FtsI (penicillin-binding protein 3)
MRLRYWRPAPAFGVRRQASRVRPSKPIDLDELRQVRVGVLLLLFIAAFVILAGRAFQITVIKHDYLTAEAESFYRTATNLPKPRGDILDRRGAKLATTVETFTVYADPKLVKTPNETATVLASILGLDVSDVRARLVSDKGYKVIKHKLTAAESAALDQVDPKLLRGVGREKEGERVYPLDSLAATVIGITNHQNVGQEGLEQQYEAILAGEPGRLIAAKDAKGHTFAPDGIRTVGRKEGGTLRLTLDTTIQSFAENALDGVVEEFKPAAAWAIVMDVRTGEVLALANRPTQNPNQRDKYRPLVEYRNHAVMDMYEPGSTMKPLTVALAVDSGKVRLDETINCAAGSLVFNGKPIRDTHPHGALTPSQIVQVSSNIGAAKLALRIGKKDWWEGCRRFGLGQRTGIDFPWEMPGQLRRWETYYPVDLATQGFGQGISVTSLQLLTAMAVIGNGGRLMRPYLVGEIVSADEQLRQRNNPQIVRRVLSEATANEVLRMMTLVTQEGGTGKRAALKNFLVAGKTGTAQKVQKGGGYSSNKYIGSFVGLVPGDNPVLGIIVTVDEPKGAIYGGLVAAPAFHDIAERSLDYLGIYSTGQQEETLLAAAIEKSLHEAGGQAGAPAADRVRGEDVTPDFVGLTIRGARQLAADRGLTVAVQGSGIATKQTPAAGAALPADKRIVVEFTPQM